MATTTSWFNYRSGVGNHDGYIYTSEDNYNVYVSVSLAKAGTWGAYGYFDIHLQRLVNGVWTTIGTKWYNYVNSGSSGVPEQPAHVTFENIAMGLDKEMRIQIDYQDVNGWHFTPSANHWWR